MANTNLIVIVDSRLPGLTGTPNLCDGTHFPFTH